MFKVEWKSGEAKGTFDLFPSYWLDDEGFSPSLQHTWKSVKEKPEYVRCSLNVKGNLVEFYYGGEHIKYNQENEFDIGTLSFTFQDARRKGTPIVRWRDEGCAEFSSDEIIVTELKDDEVYSNKFDPNDIHDGRIKIDRLVAIRQGQSKFRDELLSAYQYQCAITKCSVVEVLQAAHILPYRGMHTNHVTNGILLRADIHTLFDLGILKIDENFQVNSHSDIKRAFGLPDRIVNLPYCKSLYPNIEALEAKWPNKIKKGNFAYPI